MKRFLKTILLFLIPVVVALGLLEYGMRNVPNDYSYKCRWLDHHISDVSVWIFGSSHALYGINPNLLSLQAFNSAHPSQTLHYDAFIFDKYIDCAANLKWVILPVSYFTFTDRLENSEEWWRIKNYCLYYDCPEYKWQPEFHSEVLGNPLPYHKQIVRIGKYLIYRKSDLACDSLGFRNEYTKSKRTADWTKNGPLRVQTNTKDLSDARDIIEENARHLEAIVQACEARNINILLVTTPVSRAFYECMDSAQYALTVETAEKITAVHSNVHYMNLLKDARFTDDDFFDADHLELDGAAKLTKIIDGYISE